MVKLNKCVLHFSQIYISIDFFFLIFICVYNRRIELVQKIFLRIVGETIIFIVLTKQNVWNFLKKSIIIKRVECQRPQRHFDQYR